MMNEAASVFAGLALLSLPYFWMSLVYVERWLREARTFPASDAPLPPISFLRPIKRGVPELRGKLELLVRSARAGDQIVFGADAGSAEAECCDGVRAQFSERDIVVVRCAPGAAVNPKISKLVQMEAHARHEHWLLSDSETLLDARFLEAFRREWTHCDVLTAAYRFRHLDTWPQRLDAAAVLLTLWPGLAFLRARGSVRFTLGACTALRRGDLAALGGWKIFGYELAEDNRLGVALAAAGKTVRLSAHVATLDSDALGWRDYWRHQRRVAVTYRAANPAGFAGMVLVNGEAWCVLIVLLGPSRALGVALGCAILTLRILAARRMARLLDFPVPRLAAVVAVSRVVETACWCASWFTRSVWWSGQRWRMSFRGRLAAS